MIKKKIPIIPDCYKELKDDAILNGRDVANMFGYKTAKSLTDAYQRGNIPKPDKSFHCSMRLYAKKNNFWTLGTIRKWGNE